ncbi:mitochondrial ribosomal protein subunit L20-domain-containing protein [Syncephalis plumigaleata]|nr:mitochondrial ribosomal protein subunit L20-domain-containing protein [Syncephalis plumigaleata]
MSLQTTVMFKRAVTCRLSLLHWQQSRMCINTKAYSKSLGTALASAVYHRELSDGSVLVSRVPRVDTTNDQANEDLSSLPPPLKPIVEKKFHLTEADKQAMRELRIKDPTHWTQKRLADKFGCSRLFVALVAPCPEEQRQVLNEQVNKIRENHGYKRRLIGINRQRRRELW